MDKKLYLHSYYLAHLEHAKKSSKEYYQKHRDKLLQRQKVTGKIWRESNLEIIRKKSREWNKEYGYTREEYRKKYYQKNKERHKILLAKNYQKNKYNIFEKERTRIKTDPTFAMKKRLRCLLRYALNNYGNGKKFKASKYGVDYNTIIEHLKPFPENISQYHIDHIKPLCTFNLTDFKEIKEAFAPENHQWLLAQENLQKGSRY